MSCDGQEPDHQEQNHVGWTADSRTRTENSALPLVLERNNLDWAVPVGFFRQIVELGGGIKKVTLLTKEINYGEN